MLVGQATSGGTAAYAARYQERFASDFYAPTGSGDPLTLSGIGSGTYLGPADEETDSRYEDALAVGLTSGVNHVDTAVNYRAQASERLVGRVLARLVGEGALAREEVLVATKGGYLPRDREVPEKGGAALLAGIPAEEVVQGSHCLHPRYLERMLSISLKNLGLAAVDVYYLHNPEQQLPEVSKPVFYDRLRRAFAHLEQVRARGEIGAYGLATWAGFRRPLDDAAALDMARIVDIARVVGGAEHGLRWVQLPISLVAPEAVVAPTQRVDDEALPAVAAAQRLGLGIVASASLGQGEALERAAAGGALDPERRLTAAQRALRFTRSSGAATALVGASRRAHLLDDLGAGHVPRLDHEALQRAALAAAAAGEGP